MNNVRHCARKEASDDRRAWRVVDDFSSDIPIGPAELDALEAFLMPLVNAILRGELPAHHDDEHDGQSTVVTDSQAPQKTG